MHYELANYFFQIQEMIKYKKWRCLMDLEDLLKDLSYYSIYHLGRSKFDQVYLENLLLDEFNLSCPSNKEINVKEIKELKTPDKFIDELKNIGISETKITKIFALLTPSPSQVIDTFNNYRKIDSTLALDYLYNLQIKNNYIKKSFLEKNIHWINKMKDNEIEITINLSKPEKNNSDIIKNLLKKEENKYPQCSLCIENMGYRGDDKIPPRQNLRILPLSLNNEEWFLQFSPYGYFQEHAIIINKVHKPMRITKSTFFCLCDFVDQFDSYFIGSNCDLPIVGGSILSHEHYQGGKYTMPLMKAKDRYIFKTNNKIKVSYLDWFNSCVKVESKDKKILCEALEKIKEAWYSYQNDQLDIIPFSNGQRHNGITPIIRKENKTYIAYIILRNNYCNKEFPEGIFHAHKEYHNIKHEGIGLIEAMGYFILPGRLKNECEEIEKLLENKEIDLPKYYLSHKEMKIHHNLINKLINNYGLGLKKEFTHQLLIDEINSTCVNILKNTAVFKNDERGNKEAIKFIESIKL